MKKINIAIVFFILVFTVNLSSCNSGDNQKASKNNKEDNNIVTNKEDYPPMVMINGKLYKDTGYVSSAGRCGNMDGEITSTVDGTKMPTKDNESNFGKGYEYQFWKEHRIDVHINKKFVIFNEIGFETKEIPEDVAHFKAKVLEVFDGIMRTQMLEVSNDFNYLWNIKDKINIKPIELTIENLDYSKNEEFTTQGLVEKIVEIWFDGTIENIEPETSYPIKLGQVYKIKVLDLK